MKAAFEKAVKISYYVGKLWDVATNPDISQGQTSADYCEILIPKYGHAEDGDALFSGQIPALLRQNFAELAAIGVSEDDDLTRGALQRSLTTLHRVVGLSQPVEGKVLNFSKLQQSIKTEISQIDDMLAELKLA